MLFKELTVKEKLTKKQFLDTVFENPKNLDVNFQNIEGNKTISSLYKAYKEIIELSGHGEFNFEKMNADEIHKTVFDVFKGLNYNTEILSFILFDCYFVQIYIKFFN